MATRVSTQAPAKAKPEAPQLKIKPSGGPRDVSGILRTLGFYGYDKKKQGQFYGALSDSDLLNVCHCAGSAFDTYAVSLKTVGKMIAAMKPKEEIGSDAENIGDMINALTVLLEEAHEIFGFATVDLARRGYDFNGEPLGAQA